MVSLEIIAGQLLLAKAFYVELLVKEILDLENSLKSEITKRLVCLNRLIRALTWDVNDDVNDQDTQDIYQLLLKEISDYPGSVLPFDPDVVIPGSTIVVSNTNTYREPLLLTVTNLEDDGKTYINTDLANLNQFIIQLNGVRTFIPGTDYNYSPAGGFVLTEQIFDGQVLVLIF